MFCSKPEQIMDFYFANNAIETNNIYENNPQPKCFPNL